MGVSDASVKFLNEDQAIALQTINGCRDSAHHHLLEISEQQLYMHAQSGVTLFGDLLASVFNKKLINYLPARVLPISTIPPEIFDALFSPKSNTLPKC